MINIKKYFPDIYENILEIDLLSDTLDKSFNNLDKEFLKAILNSFVITADVNMIKEYEAILKINDTELKDIEFRRQRILNRLAMNVPYTIKALRHKLNDIIGENNYKVYVDNENYTLYLESKILSQDWFTETYITINKMKPANIVFINKPFMQSKILINEEVTLAQREYNYKLGIWQLGVKPFKSLRQKGVVKMKEESSVSKYFLDQLRDFSLDKVGYIKVNETKKLTDFITKNIVDGKLILEYAFLKEYGISEINKIDVYTVNNEKLTSINLYVPIIEDIELKHAISIEEGVV